MLLDARASAVTVLVAALLAPWRHAPAQGTPGVIVSGVVRDTLGRPLGDAEISVVNLSRSTRTANDGVYALMGVPAGDHRIVVKRVGYEAVTLDARVEAGSDVRLDVDLVPTVPELAGVVVEGEAPYNRMAAFENRRKYYVGTFLDEGQIRKKKAFATVELVRGSSGIKLKPVGMSDRFEILMGVGPMTCRPSLFLDGVPTNEALLYTLKPDMIVAVEIYRKSATAPPPYPSSSPCGVIGFWSRSGPPKDDADSSGRGH
jgi:hypothetical protein